MPHSKRPWQQIERDYVEEGLSLAELSERWGVPQRTLQTHCAQGSWVAKRRQYQQAVAAQRDSLIRQLEIPVSVRTAEHWAATRAVVGVAREALEALQREIEQAIGHDAAERGKDQGSLPALASITPVMREWVGILDKAVRLERDVLALQYEHPAKAIQYLLRLGYEVRDLSGAVPRFRSHPELSD